MRLPGRQIPLPTLRQLQAHVATTANYKRGSPEHEEARRKFWSARALRDVKDAVAKSPPFTQAQREEIIAVLCAGDPAPESTVAP